MGFATIGCSGGKLKTGENGEILKTRQPSIVNAEIQRQLDEGEIEYNGQVGEADEGTDDGAAPSDTLAMVVGKSSEPPTNDQVIGTTPSNEGTPELSKHTMSTLISQISILPLQSVMAPTQTTLPF